MVICRRFGRACPRGTYWTLLVQRATELFGAPPADTPTPVQLAAMSKLPQRITLRDLLVWADARGVLVALVAFLESFPRDGWTYMEDPLAGLAAAQATIADETIERRNRKTLGVSHQ